MNLKIDAFGNGTKDVEVRTPCTCGARRWFLCTCASVVAVYEVDVFDTVTDRGQVQWIHQQHPGMDLIY